MTHIRGTRQSSLNVHVQKCFRLAVTVRQLSVMPGMLENVRVISKLMSVILIRGTGGEPVQLGRIASGGDFPGPVYFCGTTILHPSQPPGAPCMLMEAATWHTVRRPKFTHMGAFGTDFGKITINQISGNPIARTCFVVWKFPADLRYRRGYDLEGIPLPVGTYPMTPDNWCDMAYSVTGGVHMGLPVTKMRIDYAGESIHSMRVPHSGHELPALGVAPHFCSNFDAVSSSEREKICDLVRELKNVGVTVIPCVGNHHALIFYSNGEATMTPKKLSQLLCVNGSRTARALRSFARKSQTIDKWIKAYSSYHRVACQSTAEPVFIHHNGGHVTGTIMRREPTDDPKWLHSGHEIPNGAPVTVNSGVPVTSGFISVTHGPHRGWVRVQHIHTV